MHFQFLIEDQSSTVFVEKVMTRIIKTASIDTYNCKSFKGIGGFTKKNTVKETHSGKMLNDLAIEEVEAWLLGDEMAIQRAYPGYKKNILHDYVQDSICGTWEVLADVVYKGGIREIKKKKLSPMEIGRLKSEWAERIGSHMIFNNNKSPSFIFFYETICKRLGRVV